MVDARLREPLLASENSQFPDACVRSASLPHIFYHDDNSPLSNEIKAEDLAFRSNSLSASSPGTDYEYLGRRLREFALQSTQSKAQPPSSSSAHPSSIIGTHDEESHGDHHDLISLARAVESNNSCKLPKCVVCDKGLPESFHIQKPVSWYAILIMITFDQHSSKKKSQSNLDHITTAYQTT